MYTNILNVYLQGGCRQSRSFLIESEVLSRTSSESSSLDPHSPSWNTTNQNTDQPIRTQLNHSEHSSTNQTQINESKAGAFCYITWCSQVNTVYSSELSYQ